MLVITEIDAWNNHGFMAKIVLTGMMKPASMQEAQKAIEDALDKMGDERERTAVAGTAPARPATIGDDHVFVTTTFRAHDHDHGHVLKHEGLMSIATFNEGRRRIGDAFFAMGDKRLARPQF